MTKSQAGLAISRIWFVLVVSLCLPLPGTAALVTWSLENVAFADGGIATGSFTYSAKDFSVTEWNISVSGGDEDVFPAFTYDPVSAPQTQVFPYPDPKTSFGFFINRFVPGGWPESRGLYLTANEALPDVGGTVALDTGTDIFTQSRECFACNPYRLVASGSIVGTPVPEASSFLHLLLGLVLLGLYYRRQANGGRE